MRFAVAAALALGAWSAAFAASLLLSGSAGIVPYLLGVAVFVVSAWRVPAAAGVHDLAPRWLWGLFALAALLVAAAFVEHCRRYPEGGWDAWMIWDLRARFLVRAPDFRDGFSPQMLPWAHQDYPWLLPAAVAQLWRLARNESPLARELLAALFAALLVAVVTASLARRFGMRWGLLGGLALLAMPCFVTLVADQQADVPLALFLCVSLVLLEDAPLLAGFSAGLAIWTKNEGALYAACIAAGLLVFARARLVPFLLGALPGLALFVAFKITLAPPNDLVAGGPVFEPARAIHLPLLLLRRLVFFQSFGLWLVAAIALVRRPQTAQGLALLLACAGLAAIYAFQPHPLAWIFHTSIDRLVIQLWPAAILLAVPRLARAQTTART